MRRRFVPDAASIPHVTVARVELILAELRLPAIRRRWADLAGQADKEGWPAARFLAALAEHEVAERGRRRIERHLAEARLPLGKTLDSFDFDAVPMISKAQLMALAAGDSWLASRVIAAAPRSTANAVPAGRRLTRPSKPPANRPCDRSIVT
jgi:DNA replication protein DnaC